MDKVLAAKSIKSAFKFDLWGEELITLFLRLSFELKKIYKNQLGNQYLNQMV